MRLGIDFGTTRIVAAAADRGNYPLAGFESPDGQAREWFPPLVAMRGNERRFGWNAWAVQGNRAWTVLRSLKRLLKRAGPATRLDLAGCTMPVMELATELLSAFRQQLRQASTLSLDRAEPLEAMIGVPANANSNQRFLTAEAFRAAGFHVLGMLNEPSAASVEFGHRERAQRKGQPRRSLLVYDLGGGTFDASLVEMEDDTHTVVASAGLSGSGRRRLRRNPGQPGAGDRRPRGPNAKRSPMPSRSACWRSAASARSRSIPIRAASWWTWSACAKAGARFRSPWRRTTSAAARWWNAPRRWWRNCLRRIPAGRSKRST